MENASKALIIAGAILLAIVIISLGLIVINNTRETVDNANLSEQQIQSFNAKFASFEGANIPASRVNTLIQQVIASNQTMLDEGKDYKTYSIIIDFVPANGTVTSGNRDRYVFSTKKDNTGIYLSGMKSTATVTDKDRTFNDSWGKYTMGTSVVGGNHNVTLFYNKNTSLVHYIYIE